jgi:DNA-binding NtrC family response regulator
MTRRVLIVDDEVNTVKVLAASFEKDGFDPHVAHNGEEAAAKFGENSFDLVLLDYRLPDTTGDVLLRMIKEKAPSVPVILLTAYGTIEMAVNAMREGAYTFLTKPVNLEVLMSVAREALRREGSASQDADNQQSHFYNIIGNSTAIREVFSMISRVSKTEANVLITGESGTGKELVARAIHYHSLKAGGPFIPLDCTTIPEELVESELFGHEKGAFTCAYENKLGLIEMANGGTIFLDEIGDLDFSLQKKLLRFLQEKEFFRVGGKKTVKVDARVIASTNRELEEAVEKGEFRKDLFYRLNVIRIQMPPLRERREDIRLIAKCFLDAFSGRNRKDILGFSEEVLRIFEKYDWPGNVRELENTVERAVILCPYDHIEVESLPQKLKPAESDLMAGEELDLPSLERRVILKALEKTSWNQSAAAVLLGISRKSLRTKMKNLELVSEQERKP